MNAARETENQNKALIRRWFEEVWNNGRAELIDQLRAPDAVAIGLSEGKSESRGDAAFKTFYSNMRGTLPDLHIAIEDMVAEGDKVVARFTVDGTHQGDALGVPPTGRRVSISGMVMARIADGKIAHAWNCLDQLALLKQLGALSADIRDNFMINGVR